MPIVAMQPKMVPNWFTVRYWSRFREPVTHSSFDKSAVHKSLINALALDWQLDDIKPQVMACVYNGRSCFV